MVLLSVLFIVLNAWFATIECTSSATYDLDLYQEVLDPELCQRQLRYMLENDTLLLLKFLDAGIRMPRGFFDGNSVDLGNYYQCLRIDKAFEGSRISGKYCTIQFPLIQNLSLPGFFGAEKLDISLLDIRPEERRMLEKYYAIVKGFKQLAGTSIKDRSSPVSGAVVKVAICIPKACSTEEAMTGLFFNFTAIGFQYGEEYCRLPNDKPWVLADYVTVVVFLTIVIMTLLSTTYELTYIFIIKRNQKTCNMYYRLFSVYNNAIHVLHYPRDADTLHCIDGIRTISMIWIVVCHAVSAVSFLLNPLYYSAWLISLRALGFSSIPIIVDTFFVMSGMLLVYSSARKMDSMTLLKNLHVFYLNRILRMFPLLATAVLLDASFFHRIADGPLSTSAVTAINAQRCRRFWWTTLLHLQTYINPKEICVPHSWYVASDIQLHMLSPLVLFWVLSGRRLVAWLALFTALAVTLGISATYNYTMELPAHTIIPSRNEELWDYLIKYYFQIISRITPFTVGMIFGYMLHLWRGKRVKININIVLFLWSLSFGLVSMILYMLYRVMQLDWNNRPMDSLLNTLMRPLWAVIIGWVITACSHGYGGPISWLLSLPMWQLPSRLTYGIYLIHYPIIFVTNDVFLSPQYFSVSNILFQSLSNLMLSFILSFVLTVVIEAPFTILFKRLLDRDTSKRKKKAKKLPEEFELLKHME